MIVPHHMIQYHQVPSNRGVKEIIRSVDDTTITECSSTKRRRDRAVVKVVEHKGHNIYVIMVTFYVTFKSQLI
jgi:hypothetical protein